MVTKQKLLYQLAFFETLNDTPNTSEGFSFVAFVILEIILGWVLFDLPPPLVLGVGTKTLGARRVNHIKVCTV